MGLDMYLHAEVFLFTADYRPNGEGRMLPVPSPTCDAIAGLVGASSSDLHNPGLLYVKLPVGYWRKANAIHAWFIRDQSKDDCRPIAVGLEELDRLDHICEDVLINEDDTEHLLELLPPMSGFFFGGTDLSSPDVLECYLEDVRHTREVIARCRRIAESVKEQTGNTPDFEYHASW